VQQWTGRLSPAGDGAEDAEGACEKQERATWWMDVLVGGSGQGLFTWETKELAERHIATPRPRAGRSESGGPVGICTAAKCCKSSAYADGCSARPRPLRAPPGRGGPGRREQQAVGRAEQELAGHASCAPAACSV
jgi:hypothetical protein